MAASRIHWDPNPNSKIIKQLTMAKTVVVKEQFRTNELSLNPGGYTVTVVYSNGDKRVYNNVKNPKAYIGSISKAQDVSQALVDGELYWSR